MRKFFLICILAFAGCIFSFAGEIREVAIKVGFDRSGAAHVYEKWDVDIDEGTEWYLAKYDLGSITLKNLRVTDESGMPYRYEGTSWRSDRNIHEKANRCGLIPKKGGYEICWGLGGNGHHVYHVRYVLEGAVEAMDDYDVFHMQMVSPGLSSRPQKVSVSYSMEDGTPFSADNCRIWGFGFEGDASFDSGVIRYVATERFRSNSSVISLIRFDKGIFTPAVNRGGSFQDVLDKAKKGSSYSDGEDDWSYALLFMLLFFGFGVLLVIGAVRSQNNKILGIPRKRDIEWCRDVPYGGDVLAADYVLSKLESSRGSHIVAGSMILRMIELKAVSVNRDAKGKVEFSFGDRETLSSLPTSYVQLWNMMKEASGADQILQDKEFSRWSAKHTKRVDEWCQKVRRDGGEVLIEKKLMSRGGKFDDAGKMQARQLLGLKKFLKDFTLVNERATSEVGLWNDYLVFGTLFGIADKVAKELHDINPQVFSETVYMDIQTTRSIIYMTRNMGYAITNASSAQAAKAANAGMGGHTSFGGGGGFHGGGFGGGAR